MSSFFQITPIDRNEILYLIRNLEDFEKDKAIREGLRDGGKVFAQGGKARLRRRMKSGSKGHTGNLLKSFTVRPKRSKPGVLVGFRQGINGGSHSHLVDRGTQKRFHKKNNKSVGRMPANRFWYDTEAQDGDKAIKRIYDGIERAVNKIGNRQ